MRLLAYLDPGTGSLVLQVVLGGAAGLFVAIKAFGRRLLFWRRPSDKEQVNESKPRP